MVSIEQIKKLREETGISISECKKALEASKGNLEKAKVILKEWGKEFSKKKIERETKQGIVEGYIHPGKKIGVMVELNCESDFVARSEDFQKLAHEICLQAAAMSPLFSKKEDIPDDFLFGERKIWEEQLKDSGKSKKIIDEIISGKLEKFKEEISLLSQLWIKDETKTVKDLIDEYISRLGENIVVGRFIRFEI
jgi:elongation factor Ts